MGRSAEVLQADGDDAPTSRSAAAPPTGTQVQLAEVLAGVLGVEHVSFDSHFFDDLGADSLVMAQFCARVRKRDDLPSVSMKDIYRYPTVSVLAAEFADDEPAPVEQPAPPPPAPVQPVSTAQYVLCGLLQFLAFVGYVFLAELALTRGYEWISGGTSVIDVYLRSAASAGMGFVAACALPIVAKWTLIGRWKQQELRVWTLAYFRFWLVKTLVRANPMALFAGSPLYVFYLRLLGARIGRGVVVLSKHLPVCTDLLTIGDGTVIRKDSYFNCYRAEAGRIRPGAVTLGRNVFVGEATVLDIDTSMGDDSQLGRESSLHSGQAVPEGESWHGSPAQRAEVDYRTVAEAGGSTTRRVVYSALQLCLAVLVLLPLLIGGVSMLFTAVPQVAAVVDAADPAFTSWTFYGDALAASLLLFFGSILLSLLFVFTVPRVFNLALNPERTYRLYGFHWWANRAVERMTNRKFFMMLFGDSSFVVPYLRWLGYDLGQVEQTGSNFGSDVRHDNPYLSAVGRGTMVADGLSVINTEYSATSFRLSRVAIGENNFLGNHIFYPPTGRTGDNCLLATKVMVPVDGPVRENTGLLGSPSIEIPRTVQRDNSFDHLESEQELPRRLAAKDRHNAVTIGWHLLVRWFHFFGITLFGSAAATFYGSYGVPAFALATVLAVLFSVAYFVLVERAVTALYPLKPMFCSIYDIRFWRHERFWKVPEAEYVHLLNGTPFKNLIWRLVGVRIGRRVFDNGCYLTERSLVTIGDDCTLNEGSKIQCHSQEDGSFKADHSTLGAGCTVGVNALVHYGAAMGDGAVLAPDSFLMKGEEVPNGAQWGGNPAHEIRPAQRVSGGITR